MGIDSAGRRQARRIVLGQLLVAGAIAALLLVAGPVYAYSGLLGGLIAAAANGVFARRVFAGYRAQDPGKLLYRLYGAELAKLLVLGVLLAGTLALVEPLSIAALLGAFLVVYLAPSMTPRSG